jgi:hypothetical protein
MVIDHAGQLLLNQIYFQQQFPRRLTFGFLPFEQLRP